MSLPTNSGRAKDKGCSPTSSNCVVWQGPDLECIGVCKGDTVSDVIAKMAQELCDIIEQFDLQEYDFTCLQVPVSEQPENLQDLIQILIERICALEGIEPTDPDNPLESDCPENCIVPIADCFNFVSPQGDTVTTMTLLDYVTAIGNRICDILDDITVLQNEVQTLQDQMNGDGSGDPITNPGGVVGEIGDIKDNKADSASLFYQVSTDTDPSAGTQYITGATRAIENAMNKTRQALGSDSSLYQNILKEGSIGDEERLFGNGPMSAISGWTSNVQTTAESYGNLWVAMEDVRNAVAYIQENCCSTGCSDIYLNFRASINVVPGVTYLTIFTDGSTGFTDEWRECTGQTRVTVKDALGNTTTFQTSLLALINEPSGYQIDITPTSIDPTQDIEVIADTCFINTRTETQCESEYKYEINATVNCPSVVLTIYATSLNYQFQATQGQSYIAKIYYQGGTSPVAEQIISAPGAIVFQSISGLLSETDYEFEITVYNPAGEETVCARQPFTTLIDNCTPPINASAIVTTP